MSGLADTVTNVAIFAYIGLLIWLYVRPGGDGDRSAGAGRDG